jgi:hypothetical protein
LMLFFLSIQFFFNFSGWLANFVIVWIYKTILY